MVKFSCDFLQARPWDAAKIYEESESSRFRLFQNGVDDSATADDGSESLQEGDPIRSRSAIPPAKKAAGPVIQGRTTSLAGGIAELF